MKIGPQICMHVSYANMLGGVCIGSGAEPPPLKGFLVF